MPVMKARCPTCPFNADGDQQTRATVEARAFKGSQICHHPRLHGKKETHLCRGSRDLQLMLLHRMGFLDEPTDACFERTSREALGWLEPAPGPTK